MEELDKNIIKMYQLGTKVAEICRTLGTHTQKVYKVLKENNISKNGRRLTPEVIQEIVEKLRQDVSSTDMAEQYGCSVWTIHKIMREHDIPMQVVDRGGAGKRNRQHSSPMLLFLNLHKLQKCPISFAPWLWPPKTVLISPVSIRAKRK